MQCTPIEHLKTRKYGIFAVRCPHTQKHTRFVRMASQVLHRNDPRSMGALYRDRECLAGGQNMDLYADYLHRVLRSTTALAARASAPVLALHARVCPPACQKQL